ncbi:hypothetical protein CDAR_811 [Caerostris darwini]|uniref:Uncharacterized protein n=1 Tax=Caerostris darwini TaxID=1538125 RepID=A0AAV4MM62_9ARAC|nr:hypothetical protein CDAR_811 [Caerostris darwini]
MDGWLWADLRRSFLHQQYASHTLSFLSLFCKNCPFAYGGGQKAFDSLELGISRIHQGMQRIKKTFQRATLLIHPINNIRVNQTEKFRFGNAN